MGSFGGTGIRLIAAISALRPGGIKSSILRTRRQACSLRADHPGAQQLWGAREAAAFKLMAAFLPIPLGPHRAMPVRFFGLVAHREGAHQTRDGGKHEPKDGSLRRPRRAGNIS